MILCPNCGRENADNFNFCLDCGFDLKSYRASQTPTAPATHAPPSELSSSSLPPQASPPQSALPQPAVAPPSTPPQSSFVAPPSTPAPEPFMSGHPTETLSEEELSQVARSTAAATPSDDIDYAAPPPMSTPPGVLTPPATRSPLLEVEQQTAPNVPAPSPVRAQTAQSMSSTPPSQVGSQVACGTCGSPVPMGNKFCGSCGAPLDDSGLPKPAQEGPAGRTMFMHAADLSQLSAQKTCKLVTIDQSGREGMTYSLRHGETACGRINGLVLFYDDPFVSPSHCLFRFDGKALVVVDQGSLNGLFTRVKSHVLDHGDELRIGRQLLRYEGLDVIERAAAAPDDDTQLWGSPLPKAFGRLVQILEDGHAGEVRLLSGDSCRLGREHGEIVYPTDGFISGRHCAFTPSGNGARVEDLGSSNGTYLRVRGQAVLGHGDFLLVGNQMLRIEIV